MVNEFVGLNCFVLLENDNKFRQMLALRTPQHYFDRELFVVSRPLPNWFQVVNVFINIET